MAVAGAVLRSARCNGARYQWANDTVGIGSNSWIVERLRERTQLQCLKRTSRTSNGWGWAVVRIGISRSSINIKTVFF